MNKKAKFILGCIREEKKWIFVEKIREKETGGRSYEFGDLVCFCYRDYYVKIKIEVGKFKIGKYLIKVWEDPNKKDIQYGLWTEKYRHRRWTRIYLLRPALPGKFKTVIKSYD